MDNYKFFEKLKGKNIKPYLSKREKDEIWDSIKGKLYEKKKKGIPLKIFAIAATIILFFGIGFLTKYLTKNNAPVYVSQKYSMPMIETWEGTPEVIYETQFQDVKVAFVVDSKIEW